MKTLDIHEELTRTFDFGKVAYWPTSRKSNAVEVKIALRKLQNGQLEFSASGSVWNCRHTDILCGGQSLDTIREYVKDNPLFEEIYDLWHNFHLNGMYSGTKKQIEALKKETDRRNAEHKKNGEKEEDPLIFASRYEDACEYLKKIGLYYDSLGNGEVLDCENPEEEATPSRYAFGHGWITRILSENTLKRIESLIDKGVVYGGK